jgi:hypothetical protein
METKKQGKSTWARRVKRCEKSGTSQRAFCFDEKSSLPGNWNKRPLHGLPCHAFFAFALVLAFMSCTWTTQPSYYDKPAIKLSVIKAYCTSNLNDSLELYMSSSGSSHSRNFFYWDKECTKVLAFTKIYSIPGHTHNSGVINYISAITPVLDPSKDTTIDIDTSVVFYGRNGGEAIPDIPVKYQFNTPSVAITY